jgi:hypothetical protein
MSIPHPQVLLQRSTTLMGVGTLPSVDWFGLYYTNVEGPASVKLNELPDYPLAGERVMHF